MGDYNPHVPQILGQEWVPIREELTEFSPTVNAVEEGFEFTTTASNTVIEGQYYNNYFPLNQDPFNVDNQTMMIAVYPYGEENRSGPVQRVVIPVNAGNVTGADIFTSSSLIARTLFTPDDTDTVNAQGVTAVINDIGLSFAINAYSQILSGKRILGVNLLYSLGYDPQTSGRTSPNWEWKLKFPYDVAGSEESYGLTDFWVESSGGSFVGDQKISRLKLGEINPVHGANVLASATPHPWTITELQRFERSNATPIQLVLSQQGGSSLEILDMYYAAMEIIFCEEQRIIVGTNYGRPTAALGINTVTMRTVTTGAASPSLPAGHYTVTLTSPDTGDSGFTSFEPDSIKSTQNQLNALRQLYTLPYQHGVKVTHPFPVDDTIVGQVFTREETDVLTHVTLHTATSPLTDMQVYGRQAVAQVYGSVTAIQKIFDTPVGGAANFPYVRFYARRFADTQIPLKFFSNNETISGAGNFVYLTPDEFDALEPENGIIDGWKEVTLQFPTAPVMGTGFLPDWRWSASTEDPGNRWEILGAYADAVSGSPGGNYLVTPPTYKQLSTATYPAVPAVSGAQFYLSWVPGYNPPVSSTTADINADAVLLFSQYPPAITGLGSTLFAQPITGIGSECSDYNCCIPTAILYNKVQWSTPLPIVCDHFDRVTANGWGTYRNGMTWTLSGTAADWSTNGSAGIFDPTAGGSQVMTLSNTGTSLTDVDVTVKVTLSDLNESSNHTIGLVTRFTDTNNFMNMAVVITKSTQLAALSFESRVAAVTTTTSGGTIPYVWDTSPSTFFMRAQTVGRYFRLKVWQEYDEEPTYWQMEAADSANPTGTVGVRTVIGLSQHTFDNFLAVPFSLLDSVYELQRMDQVSPWQTIMRSTDLCVNSFNDYEARVGLTSSYRIRTLNCYEFEGQWSSTATGIITSPGVSGGPCLNGSNVLIFTSNFDQSGSSNLAYIEAYEGRPEQVFGFVEASTLQLQRMYRRNFQVAFKGTERGGESFTRMILVNAAAVSPPRLGNMHSLRDMAWAELPYVAVRDDIGDRWLSAVAVPSNKIWKRKIYLANIGIVEVTDTPYPVNP